MRVYNPPMIKANQNASQLSSVISCYQQKQLRKLLFESIHYNLHTRTEWPKK